MVLNDNNVFNEFIGQIYIGDSSKKYYSKFDTTSSNHIIYDAFDSLKTLEDMDEESSNNGSSNEQFKKIIDNLCVEIKNYHDGYCAKD